MARDSFWGVGARSIPEVSGSLSPVVRAWASLIEWSEKTRQVSGNAVFCPDVVLCRSLDLPDRPAVGRVGGIGPAGSEAAAPPRGGVGTHGSGGAWRLYHAAKIGPFS